MPTATRDVTVVMVPRQRFSFARRALENLFAQTGPCRLVYVDAGSPPPLRRWLESEAGRRGFRLLRSDAYLSPNEARNLGLQEVDTEYVVFVDNDVLVAPGWLTPLVRCAEETGAWIVGPLYCIGEPLFRTIHMAGGVLHFEDRPGGRRLIDHHRLSNQPLALYRGELVREPCEFVEFHTMLVRRDVFDRVGPLDEALLSTPEHLDLCLLVRAAGGSVWFEPESVVNYVPATRLRRGDARFYMLRWSERWNRASLAHFKRKWAIADDDPFLAGHHMWLTDKRMLVLGPAWRAAQRALGWRGSRAAAVAFERIAARFLLPDERDRIRARPAVPRRAASAPAP